MMAMNGNKIHEAMEEEWKNEPFTHVTVKELMFPPFKLSCMSNTMVMTMMAMNVSKIHEAMEEE